MTVVESVCMCDSTFGYIRSSRSAYPVDPCLRILYWGCATEHWINQAALVVVLDDGKRNRPFRWCWISLPGLIYQSEVYCMSADTEAGDSMGKSHRLVLAIISYLLHRPAMRIF